MKRYLCTLIKYLLPALVFSTSAYGQTSYPPAYDKTIDSMAWKKKFRTQLQQDGYYHPRAPRNFKVGLPLMQLGDSGPHVMLGYAPRLRQVDGKNVTLVFINFPVN